MAVVDLTQDNLEATIRDNDIVLIDFWADWCGPCKQFAPVYEKVAENHPDIAFGKVDIVINNAGILRDDDPTELEPEAPMPAASAVAAIHRSLEPMRSPFARR